METLCNYVTRLALPLSHHQCVDHPWSGWMNGEYTAVLHLRLFIASEKNKSLLNHLVMSSDRHKGSQRIFTRARFQ
jgi:hypothetical protein